MSQSASHDVLIVGGGLVGATLALTLARQGVWRIALVEKTRLADATLEQLQHPSFDARNTALSNGTCELFDQLGLWAQLKPNAEAIRTIEVSDQGAPGHVLIDAAEERVEALGYVVENRWMGHALLQVLRDHPGVSVFDEAEFLAPVPVAGGYAGQISRYADVQSVTTRLLVIADGADSPTCQRLGIGFRRDPYGQSGIVTALATDRPHHGMAWERFTPGGPLALLPQTGGRIGITWCVSSAEGERLMALDETAFMAALQSVAGSRAGRFTAVGQRFSYPLRKVVADEQVRPHLVVLGNAAHALHPVAGQGLNMALRDVVELARMLAEAHQQGREPGDFALLQQYFGARSSDQAWTLHFADQLVKLFSRSSSTLRWVRSAGMTLFDLMPGAKQMLARQAMGRAVSMQIPGRLA